MREFVCTIASHPSSTSKMSVDPQISSVLPSELADRVQTARISGEIATLVVDATGMPATIRQAMEEELRGTVASIEGVADIRIAFTGDRGKRAIVAVGSGKGGVGKSTLTANLAVALKRAGVSVGVVDADVYGPSQPKLLASEDAKPQARDKQLIPVPGFGGIPMLSMGHLVEAERALAWRGPMAAGALTQLMEGDWGGVDVLLLDLPPGTGDVQLTMVQKFKPDGAVIVSTPQDLALIDAKRAMQLFEQTDVPIIGLVENMSGYECPHCGEVSDPFGAGGVESVATEIGCDFLGRIPLTMEIREASDTGSPPAAKEGPLAEPFSAIASQLTGWLEEMAD